MNPDLLYRFLKISLALVWLVNGLYAKVLQQVPRHQQIVAEILGEAYAPELTILIGLSEILMAIWILWGIYSRLNAIVQISIVLLMNIMEFALVPDLLLWGRWNLAFAVAFCFIVYLYEFQLKPRLQHDA